MKTYKSTRHQVYNCLYHVIIVTKYRLPKLVGLVDVTLKNIISNYDHPNFIIYEYETDKNHLHILCEIPPNTPIATEVGKFKGHTSRKLGSNFKWAPSFYVSTIGGAPLEKLKQYINNQGK